MSTARKPTYFNLPAELRDLVDEIAATEQRSATTTITILLREAIAARKRQEGLSEIPCYRTVWIDGRIEQCGLPVDHDPDDTCPGNPHARPAPS